MARRKSTFTEDHRQAAILIAILMNEMAIADKYESLTEAASVDRPIINRYASYSAAALDGISKYSERAKEKQTADAALSLMSEAIAAVDGITPVGEKQVRYAKAARHAIQTYQKQPV